jgi:tetratricopeptide (TPR) repeat protein
MKKILIVLSSVFTLAINTHAQSLQSAIKNTDNENFELAESELKSLIKNDTSKAYNYYFLGENYFYRNEKDSALYYWKLASNKNIKQPYTFISRGKLNLLDKNVDGAKANFAEAISLDKKNADIYRSIAKAYLSTESGQFDEVLLHVDKAIDLDEKNEDNFLIKGDALMSKSSSNVNEAIKNYNNVLTINSKSARGLVRIAKIYVRIKSSSSDSSANAYFLNAQKLDPSYAPAYREHAEFLMSVNKINKALDSWKKYMEINNSLEARYRYTTALFLGNQYCEVIKEASDLKNNGFDKFYVDRMLMISYLECKEDQANLNKGLEVSNQFFKVVPADKILATDYKYKGMIYDALGSDSLAIVEFQKSYDKEEKDKGELLGLIGKSYLKSKNYPKAIETYEKKSKESVLQLNELFDLGRAYYAGPKNYKLADTTFGTLVSQAPEFVSGIFWKARSSYQLDPKNEKWLAKPFYQKTFDLIKPEDRAKGVNRLMTIESGKFIAEYYIKSNDKAKAKEVLTIVSEVDPSDAQVKKLLSELK